MTIAFNVVTCLVGIVAKRLVANFRRTEEVLRLRSSDSTALRHQTNVAVNRLSVGNTDWAGCWATVGRPLRRPRTAPQRDGSDDKKCFGVVGDSCRQAPPHYMHIDAPTSRLSSLPLHCISESAVFATLKQKKISYSILAYFIPSFLSYADLPTPYYLFIYCM